MKKRLIIITTVIIILVLVFVIFLYLTTERSDMGFVKEGKTSFKYNNSEYYYTLSSEDLSIIKALLDNKRMYSDNLSCGFTENVAVIFDNSQTFCFACDTCPIVYWKEKNKYIKLSDEEKEQLYKVLEKYNFVFPCV